MREILFRGKRVDNGEWVEGYYVCVGNKYHYILSGKIDLLNGVGFEKYEVIPETVSQYPGLTDKNGKKTFEHAIVTDKKTGIVGVIVSGIYEECPEYYADHNGYYIKWIDKSFKPQLNFWCRNKYIEVIGNIFDNPELLESEEC